MALSVTLCSGQKKPIYPIDINNCLRARADWGSAVSNMSHDNITVVQSSLIQFAEVYASLHGYISMCVCAFGIVTNFFNITVLTRKKMRTSTNYILSWLAVSDIITMLSYLPFALHFYCFYPPGEISSNKNNHSWMTFMLIHVNLSATTHTTSIWLCVALAIFRYLHIRSPSKGLASRRRRMRHTKLIVLLVYIGSIISLIPNYMSNALAALYDNSTGETVYVFRDIKLGSGETAMTFLVNAWLYSLTAKIIPCVLMSIFGALLINNIHFKNRDRRKRLVISGASSLRLTEHSRTTKMLLAVIVLFLVTEFPQGVLLILSAVVPTFFETTYLPLGDVMDVVALINNAVNFVLYCTMSAQFRRTFLQQYCILVCKKKDIVEAVPLRKKPDGYSNSPQS